MEKHESKLVNKRFRTISAISNVGGLGCYSPLAQGNPLGEWSFHEEIVIHYQPICRGG
jgi:hypothetical protein